MGIRNEFKGGENEQAIGYTRGHRWNPSPDRDHFDQPIADLPSAENIGLIFEVEVVLFPVHQPALGCLVHYLRQ